MKIYKRISGEWSRQDALFLSSYDIDVEIGADSFQIEDGSKCDELVDKIRSSITNVSVYTTYDKKDLESADYLVYMGGWESGYPQPEDNFGYLKLTYNLSDYCNECGIRGIQKEPFRFKNEPKWGTNSLLGLNWIFDEIFTKKDIFEKIFEPIGIKSKPVLLFKNDLPIENTLQLDIETISADLNLSNQPNEVCIKCKRKKYSPQIAGYFPSFINITEELPIFKSKEYFGNGGQADNRIFITQAVRAIFIKNKIKVNLIPVAKK